MESLFSAHCDIQISWGCRLSCGKNFESTHQDVLRSLNNFSTFEIFSFYDEVYLDDMDCTRRSKDNLQESVLSFYHMVLGIKSRLPGLNTHSPWKKQSNRYLSDRCASWMSLSTSSTPGWYVPLVQAVTSNGFLNFSSALIISSGRCKFPTELLWAVNELKQVGVN